MQKPTLLFSLLIALLLVGPFATIYENKKAFKFYSEHITAVAGPDCERYRMWSENYDNGLTSDIPVVMLGDPVNVVIAENRNVDTVTFFKVEEVSRGKDSLLISSHSEWIDQEAIARDTSTHNHNYYANTLYRKIPGYQSPNWYTLDELYGYLKSFNSVDMYFESHLDRHETFPLRTIKFSDTLLKIFYFSFIFLFVKRISILGRSKLKSETITIIMILAYICWSNRHLFLYRLNDVLMIEIPVIAAREITTTSLYILFAIWYQYILRKRLHGKTFVYTESMKLLSFIVALSVCGFAVSLVSLYMSLPLNDFKAVDFMLGSFMKHTDLSILFPAYLYGCSNFLGNTWDRIIKMYRSNQYISNVQTQKVFAESELAALQSRVNPHFLYNSLNSIAALADKDSTKTKEMALALSEFYKYSTNREDDIWTTIPNEIEMIKKYLEVEKIRFGDKLKYNIVCEESVSNYKIPKFLIQPLVENAVKYGYNTNDDEINILISANTDERNRQLSIAVQDSGPDFPDDMDMGHGIKSVQKKLNLTYPESHSISFSNKRINYLGQEMKSGLLEIEKPKVNV